MSESNFDHVDPENESTALESGELVGQTSGEAPLDDEVSDEVSADAGDSGDDGGSDEVSADAGDSGDEEPKKEKKKIDFTIYDGMLLIALICVSLATLRLVFELRKFSNFPFSAPWRTTEVNWLLLLQDFFQ